MHSTTHVPPAKGELADAGSETRKDSVLGRLLRSNLKLGANRDVRLAAWLLAALACGFLAYVARMHEITHDAFHEMSLFREALVLGNFPTQDVFAYTPTVNPSVHHEWATGAVLYFVTIGTGMGLMGLSVLKLAMMLGLWLLLYRVARMRGAHPVIFAVMACLTFPVLWVGFATVRAQLFTLVFVAAQLWMQELDWRGRRAWVLLWLVMLLAWLNLHAGFVVGLGLIAFHSVERFIAAYCSHKSLVDACRDTWHLMLAAPAALCVLPLNPYGWQYIPYLVRAIRMDRPLIREWLPLWHTYNPVHTIALFAMSVALFVYAQRRTKLVRLRGSAFLALCIYMTVKHIRHGSIFAVVWIAYVPAWISHTSLGKGLVHLVERHRLPAIRASQGIACAALMFAIVNHFWLPTLPPRRLYSTACYPTGAVEYLKQQHFTGNLMTPFHVGSYVSWEMYPNVKVSFDGRYEVAYQEQLMPEHNQFLNGEGDWWTILDKYPTDAVLVHRQAPVVQKLRAFCDGLANSVPATKLKWRIAYEDDSFLIVASENCRLPNLDRRGEQLPDGAWEAFSAVHAHWNRHPGELSLR